ncbi:MAG: peptidyl-prolyl cis-trans isomerase [Sphingomonadales bacterium]|nr:peptidyl-prolyl cis-trans isomerase [Sphingomonadales bacterium]
MLSIFRRGVTAKIMLGVLFLSLVAIVITGFGTGGMGGLGELGTLGQDIVAKVGGTSLTTDRVRQETTRQLDKMRQQDPNLDMTAFLRRGALEQIVDQLIDVVAGTVFGKDHGLAASRKMIDREIASIPAFQNLGGQFDNAAMQRALQAQKMTEGELRDELETRLIQRQLMLPVAGSAHVPASLAFQYASLLLETRTGVVGAVPSGAMGAGTPPSDAEIANFFRANIGRYTIPERRVLRYALFGKENVAAAAKATDAEIAAAYRQNAAQYGARETRTLSQVVLPDEGAARAFAQKLGAGTSFAAAAAQAGYGASDIKLGDKTKEDFAKISAQNVADAVFSAAKGANVGPVRSGLGWHIVHVDDVKIGTAKPLAAVRGDLAAAIEAGKAQNALSDFAGRIENEIADGASFEQVAKKEGLTIQETAPVTASGQSPDVPGWTTPAEVTPLLDAAFQTEPNEDPSVETVVPNQRFALVYVSRVVPAAPPPLAQIRDRVTADLIAQRASERARAVAQSIVSKINAGTAPAEAFRQANVALPPLQPLKAVRRDIAKQGQQVPPQLQTLFTLPRGKARMIPAAQNLGWLIVYLDTVVPGDANKEPGLIQAVRSQFTSVVGDEYAQQLVGAIRGSMKIRRNETAIAKLKGELAGNRPTS